MTTPARRTHVLLEGLYTVLSFWRHDSEENLFNHKIDLYNSDINLEEHQDFIFFSNEVNKQWLNLRGVWWICRSPTLQTATGCGVYHGWHPMTSTDCHHTTVLLRLAMKFSSKHSTLRKVSWELMNGVPKDLRKSPIGDRISSWFQNTAFYDEKGPMVMTWFPQPTLNTKVIQTEYFPWILTPEGISRCTSYWNSKM